MSKFGTLAFASAAGLATAPLAAAPPVQLAQASPQAGALAKATPTRALLSQALEANFKRADTNGDGSLIKAEVDALQQRTADSAAAAVRTRMEQEFGQLDTDRNGQLSRAEFRAAAPKPGLAAGDTTLQRVDGNKDGKVSLDEYRAPMLAAFDRIDANRDGTLSDAEGRAARAARAATR